MFQSVVGCRTSRLVGVFSLNLFIVTARSVSHSYPGGIYAMHAAMARHRRGKA